MNILFSSIFLLSCILLLFSNPEIIMPTILTGSKNGIELAINLIAIYAFMMGLLELMDKTSLNKKLANILQPILKYLFGEQNDEVNQQIAINLSSNILGLGNAAIPSGIKAMKLLDKGNGKLSYPMAMFFFVNSMSLQLLPTTILSIRASLMSENAGCVILPIIIISYVSTFLGIFLIKAIYKGKVYE